MDQSGGGLTLVGLCAIEAQNSPFWLVCTGIDSRGGEKRDRAALLNYKTLLKELGVKVQSSFGWKTEMQPCLLVGGRE